MNADRWIAQMDGLDLMVGGDGRHRGAGINSSHRIMKTNSVDCIMEAIGKKFKKEGRGPLDHDRGDPTADGRRS